MSKLMPCPFCGNTDLNEGHRFAEGSAIREPAVRCGRCGVQGPLAAWNMRAPISFGKAVAYRVLHQGKHMVFDDRDVAGVMAEGGKVEPLYLRPAR